MSRGVSEEEKMRTAFAPPMVVLSFLTLAGPSPSFAAHGKETPAGAAPGTIHVVFKLDPRMSGPTYGGERWISPKTYTGANAQDTVEVRASVVDARGAPTKAPIDWSPSDPELVTVSPPRGEHVKLTVKRAGESSVTLKAGGASRKLTVKAVRRSGVWQVSVSQ
jgi:hypothetical protein